MGAYFKAIRAFAFPASIVPVVVGATLAAGAGGARWALLPLVLIGSMLLHAGTNLVNEYFDFIKGVDRPGADSSGHVLVEGLLPARNVLAAGLIVLATGAAVGGVLAWVCGWPVLWLTLIGLAGGYFYTAGPVGYKYLAMGDALVFLLMGPLMVLGCYFVLVGRFTWPALLVSLPVGCLVAAILSGNNLRDIGYDRQAKVRTLENVLGLRGAKAVYCGLVIAAHVLVAAMAAAKLVGPWVLLVFLALPPAARNMRAVLRARADRTSEIATIDVRTAQHHLMFGVLLSVGLVLSALL